MEQPVKRFRGTFFELQYPDEWVVEIIEDVPCFFDPEGAGALQAAAFRHREGGSFDAMSELSAYLERVGMTPDAEKVGLFELPSGLQGAGCEFIKDERFWLANCVVQTDRMVLLLWNSDTTPDADAARAIGSAVMSLRFV